MTRREALALMVTAPALGKQPFFHGALRPTVQTFADRFDRANGPLSNNWAGQTWTLADGRAINTPALGPELLADCGLEGAYVSGKCSAITIAGSPMVSETANAHGGSKAQQFTATAFNNQARWGIVAGAPTAWYRSSVWAKRLSGTGGTCFTRIYSAGQMPLTQLDRRIESGDYVEHQNFFRTNASQNLFLYGAVDSGSNSFDTVVFDDGSLRRVTAPSTLFATRPANGRDVSVQAYIDCNDGMVGVVARLDDHANPQNFIIAYVFRGGIYFYIVLEKCENGSYSQLIAPNFLASGTPGVQGLIELRCAGALVELYWNAVRIGQATAEHLEGERDRVHGMFGAGKSSVKSFGIANPSSTYRILYAGSSITVLGPPSNTTSYQALSRAWLNETYPQTRFRFGNQARSGTNSWNNLVRWPIEGQPFGPKLVIVDYANDGGTDHHKRSAEALIRRIWSAYPDCRILAMNFFAVADPNVNNPTPTKSSQDGIDTWKMLTEHYEIPVIDYQAEIANLVLGLGHSLTEYFADTIHPNPGGHAVAASLLISQLTPGLLYGSQTAKVLPEHLFDDGTYEYDPTILGGEQYSARTGVWTDTGGNPSTSTPGSTITYSGTFASAGITALTAGASTEVSIDGGTFSNISMYQNGTYIDARAPHALTIRYLGGAPLTISNFYSI